jgi:hypothetical protein
LLLGGGDVVVGGMDLHWIQHVWWRLLLCV